VPAGASAGQVRAAYREKALATHPDRGGDPGAFCRVRHAYLRLTQGGKAAEEEPGAGGGGTEPLPLPAPGGSQDFELRDHRALVASCFERHGQDLAEHVARLRRALAELALQACEVGSVNSNERGEEMRNQCFYLSVARSYLGEEPQREAVQEMALLLKRVVEAAVLAAHPDWGGSRVGEDVQAFSDFLFFSLGSHALISELCFAVFDSVSGGVEIFRGRHYPGPEREAEQRANLLMLRHQPGHYQAMVPVKKASRPTLAELQARLDEHGVLYVVTDG